MENSRNMTQQPDDILLTTIKQSLPPLQRHKVDLLSDDDKELLVIFSKGKPGGVQWVVSHWEFLLSQMEFYRDF